MPQKIIVPSAPVLIKDLGMISNGLCSKRFGIYECPICKNEYKTRTSDVRLSKSKMCRPCSIISKKKDIKVRNSPIYSTWNNMLQRCNNKNSKHYKTYGARGIICVWKSFYDFKADMEDKYYQAKKDGIVDITIDRINNDGNYEVSNCRWIERALNSSRRHRGVPKTKEHKEVMSINRKAKPQTKARALVLEQINKNRMKPVIQIDRYSMDIICEFGSIKEAALSIGIATQNISECLLEKRKTAGGFKWKYKNKDYN